VIDINQKTRAEITHPKSLISIKEKSLQKIHGKSTQKSGPETAPNPGPNQGLKTTQKNHQKQHPKTDQNQFRNFLDKSAELTLGLSPNRILSQRSGNQTTDTKNPRTRNAPLPAWLGASGGIAEEPRSPTCW
jgi:hypothetical protein